jgi:hypothetical protein
MPILIDDQGRPYGIRRPALGLQNTRNASRVSGQNRVR